MKEKNLYKVLRNKDNTRQIEVEYWDMMFYPFDEGGIMTVITGDKNYKHNEGFMPIVKSVMNNESVAEEYAVLSFSAYIHSGIVLKPAQDIDTNTFGYFLYKKAEFPDLEAGFEGMLKALSAYYNGETFAAMLYDIDTCPCCENEKLVFVDCWPELFDEDITIENMINAFELNGDNKQAGNWTEVQQQ